MSLSCGCCAAADVGGEVMKVQNQGIDSGRSVVESSAGPNVEVSADPPAEVEVAAAMCVAEERDAAACEETAALEASLSGQYARAAADASNDSTAAVNEGDSDGKPRPTVTISNTALLQLAMDPKNIKVFVLSIILSEIIGKQFPAAVLMAIPAIIHDFLVGFLFPSQRDLEYESEWHSQNNNATFNVHINWQFWQQGTAGSIAQYGPHAWSYWIACTVFYTWLVVIISRMGLDRDVYRRATSWRYLLAWASLHAANLAMCWLATYNASQVSGPHKFVVFGPIAPVVPFVMAGFGFVWHRGRQVQAVTGNSFLKIVMWVGQAQAVLFATEVTYIIGGFGGLSSDRKEFMLFMYRLVVWPLLWCAVLIPLQRFTLVMWEGCHTRKLPMIAFFMMVQGASSRALMFRMHNLTYFLILVIADTTMQIIMNVYDGDLPMYDEKMYRSCLKRCVGDMPKVDRERAALARCLWFQAQSLIELVVIFSTAFREWAFFDSRYVFGNIYRPVCGNSGFDMNSLLLKVGVSVCGTMFGDIGTSYYVYLAGYPLKDGFLLITTKRLAWISFCVLNLCTFMITLIMAALQPGRVGKCEDFNNGCTCAALLIYKEICGCCSANASEIAASPYALCSRS